MFAPIVAGQQHQHKDSRTRIIEDKTSALSPYKVAARHQKRRGFLFAPTFRVRGQMPNQVINIPHRVIPIAFQNDFVEELRLLCILKARAGRFVLDELSQPQVEIMVRMGWLVPSGGKHYQKKWEALFPPVEGEEQYSHGKISADILDDADLFKAMLFVVGFLYLMSCQAKRRKRAPKGCVQVKRSRHNGGASHSISMDHFGMSRGWCSKMREFCSGLKVAKWKRRWVPVHGGEGVISPADLEDLVNGKRGRYRVVRGVLKEEITAKFTLLAEAKNCVPYRYRAVSNERFS